MNVIISFINNFGFKSTNKNRQINFDSLSYNSYLSIYRGRYITFLLTSFGKKKILNLQNNNIKKFREIEKKKLIEIFRRLGMGSELL